MTTLLTTHQLTLKIANKFICQQLQLTVEAGDCWGILGPNGSGKTTLLQTLAGLIPAHAGEIYLGEKNIAALSRKQIARQLGILLQDTHIHFAESVLDFCLQGRYPHTDYFAWETNADKEIALQALASMALTDKEQQNVLTLSGGERRRLSIATLLTQAPAIYLLDEPLNHLDFQHQIAVLNYLQTQANTKKIGLMMSLHDVNIAQHYCNKILLLFGDGNYLQGDTTAMLTEKNLSQLYRHPIKNHREWWQPQFQKDDL